MDSEEYPDVSEIKKIQNWDVNDFPALIDFIELLHIYPSYINKEIVATDLHPHNPILMWHISTGGWSGNEMLVGALLDNQMVSLMWYYSWKRGGHYVFRIDPMQLGFKLIRDYCKENNVSRQYVHKAKDKFDYYKMTSKITYVKPKKH